MPTIRDVAVHAQVSASTVSHVINGTRFVDPETEKRVQSAIKVLGYRPNSVARSLRRGTTNTIALIIPDNANPFFAEIARAIEDTGFAEGYNVILCNSDMSEKKEETYIRILLSKQIDGLILISSTSHADRLRTIIDAGVPVVVVDRALELDGLPVDEVLADHNQGGYLAGEYLLRLGHSNISCIAGPGHIASSTDRLKGFRCALQEGGIELREEAIVCGAFRYEDGQAAMEELLKRNLNFTAVFAANDVMALGAISVLHRARLRIPGDVSVIGFDNIMQAAAMSPAITTIAQPTKEMGQRSLTLLLQRIKQRTNAPSRVLLPTALIERESCCAYVKGKEVYAEK
jgi:LacI family transcriptional regulator